MKACATITFADASDAEGPQSVGVHVVSELFSVNTGNQFCWNVKYCFCFSQKNFGSFSIYLKNSLTGHTKTLTARTPDPPLWLNLNGFVSGGDEYTDVIAVNGSGPWSLSYPVATSGSSSTYDDGPYSIAGAIGDSATPTILGKLIATYSDGHQKTATTFGTIFDRDDQNITLRESYKTVAGVVIMEYVVGGDPSYSHSNELYAKSLYAREDVLGAVWQYAIVSESLGLISSGSFSPQDQPLEIAPLDTSTEEVSSLLVSTDDGLSATIVNSPREDLRTVIPPTVADFEKADDDVVLSSICGELKYVKVNELFGPIPACTE